jgi:probable rRNA maturation factor
MATEKNPDLTLVSSEIQVDVQVAADVSNAPADSDIRNWLEQVVAEVAANTERRGRALNKQYRNKDSATNVLSFPLADAELAKLPAEVPLALGDIVICGPVVAREASEQGKDSADHWAHMLVHGALHLFGYDHQTDEQAQEMAAYEARILAVGGVENPYETRS